MAKYHQTDATTLIVQLFAKLLHSRIRIRIRIVPTKIPWCEPGISLAKGNVSIDYNFSASLHNVSLSCHQVMQMFRGCKSEDMPPHIYSVAQRAYRGMLGTRQDQSLVFIGRSGSGKTTSMRHALQYLSVTAGSVGAILSCES